MHPEHQISKSTRERLDIHKYDDRINRVWNLIKKELPEYVQLYQKYENVLIAQGKSKAARENNLRALLSLGKIIKSKDYKWQTLTKDQVTDIVAYVMKRWADADGKETWHTADHKKFLKLFFRWVKTGRREYDRKHPEPDEIADVVIKKVPKKITREDLLTKSELKEILNACGDNFRDKALISLMEEAGSRAGETLNIRISYIEFLTNGGAAIYVNGKTGGRPIHVLKCVPHLAAWLNVHPLKEDKSSPFWIDQSYRGYGNYLTYAGARTMLIRRVKQAIEAAKKIGKKTTLTEKRVFMTLYRHTEITQSHKWMPLALSKKRHGWTPNSKMPDTYEHLVQDDVKDAYFAHHGLQPEKQDDDEKDELPKFCFVCKKLNTAESETCIQCGKPLNLKSAIEIEEKEQQEKKKLESAIHQVKEQQKLAENTRIRNEIFAKEQQRQMEEQNKMLQDLQKQVKELQKKNKLS